MYQLTLINLLITNVLITNYVLINLDKFTNYQCIRWSVRQ